MINKIVNTVSFFLLFFSFSNSVFSQEVQAGQGYYNLSPIGENGVPAHFYNAPAQPEVTSTFNQPIQTNDWWTSLLYKYFNNQTFVWEMHSWRLFPHPMAMLATRYGLQVFYPDEVSFEDAFGIPDSRYRYNMAIEDFTIGIDGLDLGTSFPVQVESYGDWHVKAIWDGQNGNQLKATMAHGSPFVYFEKTGGDAYLRFLFEHTIDNTIGTNIIGFTHRGHHYGLFAPTGASWNTSDAYQHDEQHFINEAPIMQWRAAFSSDLDGKNYFSIALLPDNSLATLQEYAQHAFAFIENTEVSWNYNDATADLTTTFTTTTTAKEGTETQTLQALYRHQWLNSSDINTNHTYDSARGEMKVFKGNTFTTTLKNHGIVPVLPLVLSEANQSKLYDFIEEERQVTQVYAVPEDTYWMGKRFSRQAELVQLAHLVGHETAKQKFLNDLKTELQDWFQADNGETNRGYFHYNADWNTMIGYPASFGSETQINDHHFHYGYFIKAVATIAQFEPDWASDANWGAMAKLLIKDVNNWDRTDTQFPFLRYFDAYAGHSWANGHGNSHWGNDQESSSEAMNFASSVYQLGLALQDTEMRDLGLFLYLNEASAIEQYWFNVQGGAMPFGYGFGSATRVWGCGADKASGYQSFELEAEYWLGINLLPMNATSLYLAKNPMYTFSLYNELIANNNQMDEDFWQDIIWMYQALNDPEAALTKYNSHTPVSAYTSNLPHIPYTIGHYHPLSGDQISPAQLLHWLNVLDNLGQVDATICADYPAAIVFNKFGEKRYVAYNPPNAAARTIHFSDGVEMFLPENMTLLYDPSAPLSIAEVELKGELTARQTVELSWETGGLATHSYWLERASDDMNFHKIAFFEKATTTRSFYEDENPLKGSNWYRLAWQNASGQVDFSNTIEVFFDKRNKNFDLMAFPNPFRESTTIQFYLPKNKGKVELQITDALGQVVNNFPLTTIGGGEIQILSNEFSAGIYHYSLVQNGRVIMTKKLVVID